MASRSDDTASRAWRSLFNSALGSLIEVVMENNLAFETDWVAGAGMIVLRQGRSSGEKDRGKQTFKSVDIFSSSPHTLINPGGIPPTVPRTAVAAIVTLPGVREDDRSRLHATGPALIMPVTYSGMVMSERKLSWRAA
jgi:hypothetical protein